MPDTTTPSTPAAQAAAERLAGMRQPIRTVDSSLLESVAPAAPDKKNKKKGKKPKPTGVKRFIKPIGGLVLALLVFHVMSPKFIKPHYSASHPAPLGAIVPLVSSGGASAITTNLSDGHLAQLSISLQMSSVGSSKIEAKDEDELLSDTIAIVGDGTYSTLLSPQGRAQLKASLLGAYQRVLGTKDGAEEVTGVYFTSFVLQ